MKTFYNTHFYLCRKTGCRWELLYWPCHAKHVFGPVQTAKTKISVCIRSVRSRPSLSANSIIGYFKCMNIGIKHGFSLTFAWSRGRCWKHTPEAAVFNTSQGTWRVLMHWKTMFDRYYCIKIENICYFSRYFFHYFVSPFHRYLANVISTDYAPSRAGQYTSRNGSKYMTPIWAYWKLHSRAITARELPC